MFARDVVLALGFVPAAIDATNDLALGASCAVNVVLVLLTLWRERRVAALEGKVEAMERILSPQPKPPVSP